jgi:CBS domain-containing protein
MPGIGKVSDIMTRDVLAVNAEDSLDVVAELFEKYDYDGLPVIDDNRRVLGIISAYEMVAESSGMHLPTLLNIMGKMSVNQADRNDLEAHFAKLREIKAKSIMNPTPLMVGPDTDLEAAAKMFAEHHRVNPLIVGDPSGVLLGVLSRYDIIRFFNEKYFQQIVRQVTPLSDPYKDVAQTKSEREIESAVGELSQKFVVVSRKRPLIWKYVAIGMFLAGLLAATALIIRIVRTEDQLNLLRPSAGIHGTV